MKIDEQGLVAERGAINQTQVMNAWFWLVEYQVAFDLCICDWSQTFLQHGPLRPWLCINTKWAIVLRSISILWSILSLYNTQLFVFLLQIKKVLFNDWVREWLRTAYVLYMAYVYLYLYAYNWCHNHAWNCISWKCGCFSEMPYSKIPLFWWISYSLLRFWFLCQGCVL